MTDDNIIPIKNIYYMLTYAFKELKGNNFEHIAGEDFDNIHDLFAEILYKGVSFVLKQGLHKKYVEETAALSTLRGRLVLGGTIREKQSNRQRLVCQYDTLSVNNAFNQIIKTTLCLLVRHENVKPERKANIKRLLPYFAEVDAVAPALIRWNTLQYDKNNMAYRMLHNMCYFFIQSLLLTTEKGKHNMLNFTDEHLNMLYQRFVLEYFKRHHAECRPSAKQITWNLSGGQSKNANQLPIMQSDIMLTVGDRTLIIDTKYYRNNLQSSYGYETLHSANLYQILAYVMNEDKGHHGNVDGMLLYARTSAAELPDSFNTLNDGNIIIARTLNLNQSFDAIKMELDRILKYAEK